MRKMRRGAIYILLLTIGMWEHLCAEENHTQSDEWNEKTRIENGSKWENGNFCFVATCKENGEILMKEEENEDYRFILKTLDNDSTFSLQKNGDYLPVYGNENDTVCLYTYNAIDKTFKVLSIRDNNHNLLETMVQTELSSKEVQERNIVEWMAGDYVDENGKEAYISRTYYMQLPDDSTPHQFEIVYTLGRPSQTIKRDDGQMLKIAQHCNGTDQLNEFDTDIEIWINKEKACVLKKTGNNYCVCTPGKLPTATLMPLTFGQLVPYLYTSKAMKLMKDEIEARHGHHFTDPNLTEYFGEQSWYQQLCRMPASPLSELEKLNTEVLQTLMMPSQPTQ